ncbi:hypothetical protein H2200_013437 [Cladophialophora chaetospira]|uniref:NACHT domain-containing protein n=1 Tax=Cladophialophora chaetospira TaxID=386627 RepID=A0AA38WPD5_9EURO|nr:hypothetical protein H2200_013437 [Cladophialophora chaetospira]
MSATQQPEKPFSGALRQWMSEVERKKGPFYELVLAAQNTPSIRSGQEECTKWARDLSNYIEELQKRRRDESKFIQLCTKLEPFVNSIAQLMKICGTVAQAAPFEVGIAFAGAQIVLQLAAKQAATFDKMVEIMAEIARNLRCYDKFSVAYETSEEVCQLLIDAYKTIIGFWHRASQILSRSSLRNLATNVIKPIDVEWKTCLENLQRNSMAVLALAQATSALEFRERQKLDLTEKIAKWIIGGEDASKLRFQSDLTESRNIRQAGTCDWIFEQPSFKSWFKANKSAVVWYNAPPGSGKTVLSASIAHHLSASGNQIVYYRFSFDDSTRKSPLTALRSIALQLRTIMSKIPVQVEECYNKEIDHHAYHLEDPEIATQVVEAFIEQMPRVHIIVDGLDECYDKRYTIEKALEMFRRLVQFPTYGITKWFFTSRDEPIIRDTMMNKLQATEITPPQGAIMNDIATFLDAHGKKLALKKCADCVQYWTAASEENFLYSKLMFDILCGDGVTCSDEIHDELQKFPPGLTGCYTRCLESLTRRKEPERNLARRMFLFLVCAAKPLTLSELCNALAIKLEDETEDHQQGRVPTLETIKLLGGSLIRVEESQSANLNDRRVKFVHKSVLDFFKDDPDRLGIGKERTDLRRFFINEKEGNLELGRNCLKYLRYKPYQRKVDIPAVLADDDENAFLKYSAAFWFEHLNNVEHSMELFSEVRSLIESPAFWTCLAVQVKVRPHLFARYTSSHGVIFELGLERGELGKDDYTMIPLPDWVEHYKPDGHNFARVLHDFVREWHEVLVSHPEAASLCQMDQTGRSLFSGLASSMSKNVRMSTIKVPPKASDVALAGAYFEKSKVHARVTYLEANTAHWQEGPISANEPSKSGTVPTVESQQGTMGRLIRYGGGSQSSSSSGSTSWSISLHDLEVERYDVNTQVFPSPDSRYMSNEWDDASTQWRLVTESGSATEYGSALAFHLATASSEARRKAETDSGYDSASDSDLDSDSKTSSWSDSEDDGDGPINDGKMKDKSDTGVHSALVTDCLMICCNGEEPLRILWTVPANDRLQVSCAFHPSRKIAVFSQHLDELQIVHFAEGETFHRLMEEPAGARASASIYCREMRFSRCGQYLYYLLVTIADRGDVGSTCEVFLSVFPFTESSRNDVLQPCTEVQRLTYKFGAPTSRLRTPYILSCWDADSLFLCLPLLSCNPKLVRFSLASKGQDLPIQTLANSIFFPSSTPCRNPRILYRSSRSEKKDILVLALDSLGEVSEEGDNGYLPAVIEWKIDKEKGWKVWDEATDGEEPALMEYNRTYAQLRGTFIDADRRFNVVVRSGLNWTKKAFLSCA